MGSFRCYDNSDVIAALMMTNCHLNTTVVAIFPNVCLRRRIEPPSYARTAYVVVIWPSSLLDAFVKIWATWKIFLGKWFTAPPSKKFLVRLCVLVMGVVPLNSVDSVTGVGLDERSKTKQTTTPFGPGSSPYAVEYSLTVTISSGPAISFVD